MTAAELHEIDALISLSRLAASKATECAAAVVALRAELKYEILDLVRDRQSELIHENARLRSWLRTLSRHVAFPDTYGGEPE